MTPSPGQREPCLWRETALMLHLMCRALTPTLSLADTISDWQRVRHRLAEPPRRRTSQVAVGRSILC